MTPARRAAVLTVAAWAVLAAGCSAPSSPEASPAAGAGAATVAAASSSGDELAGATAPDDAPDPVEAAAADGRVPLVVVGDEALSAAEVTGATGGRATVEGSVGAIGATLVWVPAGRVASTTAQLERIDGVADAYRPASARAFAVTPNDPLWPSQAGLRNIGLPTAWETTTGASSTVIAVLDTGVSSVADLSGRVLAGYDFVNNDTNPVDDAGHGTAAALVAAAAGNDGAGAAGVCWQCRVMPVKVLDEDGLGSMWDVARGIVYAADRGADVISMSLGGPSQDPAVTSAIEYALARDVVIVASAGNEGRDTPNYPAADAGVLSVAGLADNGDLASWSNRGAWWVDLAAPGCNWIFDSFGADRFCGTSSAAPVVAGVAGLLRTQRPAADRQMVATALVTSASYAPTAGRVGYGVVDAAAAVATMPGVQPGPTPLPIDVTAPSVSIGVPDGYRGGAIGVWVHATDDQKVSVIELWVDDRPVVAATNPAVDSELAFDSRPYADGAHSVHVVAYDPTGHRSQSATRTLTIDNANPVALLVDPWNGSTVSGSMLVRAYVADPNGIMGTFLIVNGRIVAGFTGAGFGQAVVPVPTRGPIRVVAITADRAGRISGSNWAVVTGAGRRRR